MIILGNMTSPQAPALVLYRDNVVNVGGQMQLHTGREVYMNLSTKYNESVILRGESHQVERVGREVDKAGHTHPEPLWLADQLVVSIPKSTQSGVIGSNGYQGPLGYKLNGSGFQVGAGLDYYPALVYSGASSLAVSSHDILDESATPLVEFDGSLVDIEGHLFMSTGSTSYAITNGLEASIPGFVKDLLVNFQHEHLLPYSISSHVVATGAHRDATMFMEEMVDGKSQKSSHLLLSPAALTTDALYQEDRRLHTQKAAVLIGQLSGHPVYPLAVLQQEEINLSPNIVDSGGYAEGMLVSGPATAFNMQSEVIKLAGHSIQKSTSLRRFIDRIMNYAGLFNHRHVLSAEPSRTLSASKVVLRRTEFERMYA